MFLDDSGYGLLILFIFSKNPGKESAFNAGDLGTIPGLGRSPGEGNGYPLHYSGPENSMDYINPWDRKESDTTERLSLYTLVYWALFYLPI